MPHLSAPVFHGVPGDLAVLFRLSPSAFVPLRAFGVYVSGQSRQAGLRTRPAAWRG